MDRNHIQHQEAMSLLVSVLIELKGYFYELKTNRQPASQDSRMSVSVEINLV